MNHNHNSIAKYALRASALALAFAFAVAGCSGSDSSGATSTTSTTVAAGATSSTAAVDDGSDAAGNRSAEMAEKTATLTDTGWGIVTEYADAFDGTVTALPVEIQDQWTRIHADLVEVAIEVKEETPSTTAKEQWKQLNDEFAALQLKVEAEGDSKATSEINKIGEELATLDAKF